MKAILKYPLYRRPQPTNAIEAIGYLEKGSVIEYDEIIQGDFIDGISTWYKANDGYHYWGGGLLYNVLPQIVASNYSNFFNDYRISDFWKKGLDGRGVNIAIIDEGFNTQHPALKDFRIVNGYKNIAAEQTMHGTYMATIIGGANFQAGFWGIVPNADFHLVEVGNIENLTPAGLIAAFSKIKSVDIISISANCSPEGFGNNETKKAIQNIVSDRFNNAIIICSAGNNGNTQAETYPASYSPTVSIAGYNKINPVLLNVNSNFLKEKNTKNILNAFEGFYNSNSGKNQFHSFFNMPENVSPNGTSSATAVMAGLFALIIGYKKARNEQINYERLIADFFEPTDVFNYDQSEKLGRAYLLKSEYFFSLLK